MRTIAMQMAQKKAETQSGQSLAFDNCFGGYFSNTDEYGLKVMGNTFQDGIPTPDAPLEIQCVKAGTKVQVCGKNLIDIQQHIFPTSTATVLSTYNGGFIAKMKDTADNVTPGSNNWSSGHTNVKNFGLNINQKCTISFDITFTDMIGANEFTSNAYQIFYASSEISGKSLWFSPVLGQKSHVSVTTPYITPTAYFLLRQFSCTMTIENFQIEIGDTETPYEPFVSGGTITTPCDLYEGDIWYPISGKVKHINGIIESYAGEDITTAYMSTTGALTEDAKVVYRLETPIIEQFDSQSIFAPIGTVNVLQLPEDLDADLSATVLVSLQRKSQ